MLNNTDPETAFGVVYAAQKDDFPCPDGGTFSWKDGTITCSKHPADGSGGGPVTPATSSVYNDLLASFAAAQLTNDTLKRVDGNYASIPGNYAYQFYNALSASQKAILDQYTWSLQKTNWGNRMFFVEKSVTDAKPTGTFGIYKYDAVKKQYQYSPGGKLNTNGTLSAGTMKWGCYDSDGNWILDGWSDTIPVVP